MKKLKNYFMNNLTNLLDFSQNNPSAGIALGLILGATILGIGLNTWLRSVKDDKPSEEEDVVDTDVFPLEPKHLIPQPVEVEIESVVDETTPEEPQQEETVTPVEKPKRKYTRKNSTTKTKKSE